MQIVCRRRADATGRRRRRKFVFSKEKAICLYSGWGRRENGRKALLDFRLGCFCLSPSLQQIFSLLRGDVFEILFPDPPEAAPPSLSQPKGKLFFLSRRGSIVAGIGAQGAYKPK